MKAYLFFLITLLPLSSFAGDIQKRTQNIELTEHTLIVTHTSRVFSEDHDLKTGVDRIIKNFKDQNLPVIYLMNEDDQTDSNWVTQDREPTYAFYSSNGDHQLSVKTNEVTVTGGFFTLCLDRTVERIIKNANNKKLIIHLPLDAIYDEKSIFMVSMNFNFSEMDFFFSLSEARTLKFYKDNLSKKRFIHGLKVFLEYKNELSYEVYLDGKKILKNHRPSKRLIKFNLV